MSFRGYVSASLARPVSLIASILRSNTTTDIIPSDTDHLKDEELMILRNLNDFSKLVPKDRRCVLQTRTNNLIQLGLPPLVQLSGTHDAGNNVSLISPNSENESDGVVTSTSPNDNANVAVQPFLPTFLEETVALVEMEQVVNVLEENVSSPLNGASAPVVVENVSRRSKRDRRPSFKLRSV